jgi:hypothetical protein
MKKDPLIVVKVGNDVKQRLVDRGGWWVLQASTDVATMRSRAVFNEVV